jgi:hypothetical protein
LPDIEEVVDFPPYSPPNYEAAGWGSSGTQNYICGTSVTAASSANSKGSWAQLIASTTRKVVGIVVLMHQSGTGKFMVDIGTGASGSESVLIPDVYVNFGGSYGAGSAAVFFPVQIPAGTRIAARCQCSTASAVIYVVLGLMETE